MGPDLGKVETMDLGKHWEFECRVNALAYLLWNLEHSAKEDWVVNVIGNFSHICTINGEGKLKRH